MPGLMGGIRGACQAHAANDASLPSLSRAPWSPLDQDRFWLTTGDRVTRLKNFRLKADYDMYQDDHGFPVTTIRPRPIVAFAIAVHTASRGAPFGSVSWRFSA
jgi:hypothetical protein